MLKLRRCTELRAVAAAACRRCLATQSQVQEAVASPQEASGEYTETAQYPAIQDLSLRAHKEREVEYWHEQINKVPTVEEKMIKVNMPRYYGFRVVRLGDEKMPYNCLPATQHYTRTVFEEVKEAKELDDNQQPKEQQQEQSVPQLDAFVQAAKGEVLEALEYAYDFFRHKHVDASQLDPRQRERIFTQLVVEQVHRVLMNTLAADCAHLQEAEVDYNPRHEAFWAVGGIAPPKNLVKSREGQSWLKHMANDPADRLMQYVATPYLAVRQRHQLAPWKNAAEAEDATLAQSIPRFNYDPRTLGYSTEHRHGTNIPGYWPGSASGFGSISYHSRAYMCMRPESYGAEDFKEALHAQAIQASYAWLLAQANYNGFNTYSELTYPMNTQTIITNGRDWSFYEYQLNTLLLHSRHVDENPRVNFCRGTADALPLYHEFSADGKCIGFDERVLRHLVKFYANAPVPTQRSAAELQPYLATPSLIADYADADQRVFLERTFKHMSANRPRHLALPEIYLWEKIYKIDHKTRPMEPKRRFFELGINPWKRTMDQHQKEYIPRRVRPEGPRSRKKWVQMHYP